MALAKTRSHKHFQLDAGKLKRAQRALRAETETETIERALDVVITEHVRNRVTVEANDRFVKSGVGIGTHMAHWKSRCSRSSSTLPFTLPLYELETRPPYR